MLILRRAVFLHVPKTGGTWVLHALRAAGAKFEEYFVDGDCHGSLTYCPCPEKFKFAFVRHPATLYASYWRFKRERSWDPLNPFDTDCAADSFDEFVTNVVARCPGWCSHMFEDYVGPTNREIEFVGRFERLADDLVHALRLSGETFDETDLRRTAPVNVSRWPTNDALWSPARAVAVERAERDCLTRFGYSMAEWIGC